MAEQLVNIVVGILGGVAVGLQAPIANLIGKRVGSAASSLVVHATGTVYSVILLLVLRDEQISQWRSLPWWTFSVGLFGVILYLTINHTIPRIGSAGALALIIIGQLSAGMLIDHFGLLGVAVRQIDGIRLLGILLLFAGGYLFAR